MLNMHKYMHKYVKSAGPLGATRLLRLNVEFCYPVYWYSCYPAILLSC